MPPPRFAPGFRLSSIDLVILVLGAIVAVALGSIAWWWGLLSAIVVTHFFLFCNVFRIARPLELAWAGVFILLSYGTISLGIPNISISVIVLFCTTIAVVITGIRSPSYHGIGWRRINPGLPEWWESHVGRRVSTEDSKRIGT